MGDKKRKPRGDDPKFSLPRIRNDMWKIVVDGETWQWKYYDHASVAIMSPEYKRHIIDLEERWNIEWDYETPFYVQPSDVEEIIKDIKSST